MAEKESTFTVFVAFAANLAVAVAKTIAAVISGSASMTAEAAHSWADTGNQGFLIVANRRSSRRRTAAGLRAGGLCLVAAGGGRPVRRRGDPVGLAGRHGVGAR